MTLQLTLTIDAPGPFAVGTGHPRAGLDDTIRPANPLPASEIKGAMRAAAAMLLGVGRTMSRSLGVMDEIFGAEGRGGAWAWSDAGPADRFLLTKRSRIRVQEQSGTVQRESLAATEVAWIRPGAPPTFTIEQWQPLDDGRLTEHVSVLLASAHAVTAVGSWRNRGMGSVSFRVADWGALESFHVTRKSVPKVISRLRAEGQA